MNETTETTETTATPFPKTLWHRLLATLLEELLSPVGIQVYTDSPLPPGGRLSQSGTVHAIDNVTVLKRLIQRTT